MLKAIVPKFGLLMFRLKVSSAIALNKSLAMTLTAIAPMVAVGGLPLKVLVLALKVNQLGKGLPLASWAV